MKLIFFFLFAFLAFPSIAMADGGLGFGTDKKTSRPNIFIAWRNSERILEVEIEVKNSAQRQLRGALALALLDDEGKVLMESPKNGEPLQTFILPPATKGGLEGKIIQMRADLAMNNLIDELDRDNKKYFLRAAIIPRDSGTETTGPTIIKSFNYSTFVRADAQKFQEFVFKNREKGNLDIEWQLETSPLPEGWLVLTSFEKSGSTTMKPSAAYNGFVGVKTPPLVKEGQHVDIRVSGIEKGTKKKVFEFEWFATHDTTAPQLSNVRHEFDKKTGHLRILATVNDDTSMIKEASGVKVEYSTDEGKTFSSRVMQYDDGNFVGPTTFHADIGPFSHDTKIIFVVTAEDIAGNFRKSERIAMTPPSANLAKTSSVTTVR